MIKLVKNVSRIHFNRTTVASVLLAAAFAAPLSPNAWAGEPAALTPEKYEELLLAMAECEIDGYYIDSNCPQKKKFDEMRNSATTLKDLAGLNASLGRKHITHPSPAIRMWAASMTSSIFGADSASQKVVLEAVAKEQHPSVLRAMLDAIGSHLAANEAIYELVVKSTTHPDDMVRSEAVSNLTSSGKSKKGALEKVMWVVENDPDIEARRFACEKIGDMEDERALPFLEKLTDPGQEVDASLYEACLIGIMNMVRSVTGPDKPSEKAYRLIVKRLSEEPRTNDRPPSAIVRNLPRLVPKKGYSFEKEWAEKAKWVNLDEVIEIVRKIVADPNASWMTRTSSVDSLRKLGAPRSMLETLLKDYADMDSNDSDQVKNKLERALKEWAE